MADGVFYLGRQSTASFIEASTKWLFECHWVRHGEQNSPFDVIWSPPWARQRKYRIHEAVSETSGRYMRDWVVAGLPEDDGDTFTKQWCKQFGPS